MGSRSKQKQIWADTEFIKRLEEVKAKASLNNRHYTSYSDLTKELVNTPAFEDVERQLVENNRKVNRKLKGVRFDKNWY